MPINIPARGWAKWLPVGWVRNAAIALAAIGVVVIGGITAVWFGSSLSVDQRIGAIGAVLGFGGLLLAVLAAIVAIAGYRFTQRRPQISVGMTMSDQPSPDDPTTVILVITPHVNNIGSATATNAKVTLFFHGAEIVRADAWQSLGGDAVSCVIPTLHVDQMMPLLLPPVVLRIARDDHDARLSWRAVADRSNDSGWYLLSIAR
jgi:hypothetical protein